MPRRPRRRRPLAVVLAGVGVLAVVLGVGVATGVVPGLPRGDAETVAAPPRSSGTTGRAELECALRRLDRPWHPQRSLT
ncbi:hypothetical protein BIU95_11115 [Curtobacterium sp. MCBA15_007]|nr:hypothetical protein BIU95_11115 [Curtobacterium sp. MCBA15_007]